jgi:hypothetical protein
MNAAISFQPRTPVIVLTLGLILAGTTTALTQERDASTHGRSSTRAKPSTGREWFPITEFGVAHSPSYARIWNLGLAHAIGGRFALGATVAITDDDGSRTVTLAPVGRAYLTPSIALDIAPGCLVHGSKFRWLPDERPSPDVQIQSLALGQAPGFALDASLSLGDWAVLFVRTSVFPYSQVSRNTLTLIGSSGADSTWLAQPPEIVTQRGVVTEHRIGVRAGSHAGLGLGVLAVVVSSLVYAALPDH